ncbi:MAG TPA: hypothetical protein ENI15_13200 [Spirochaetes bacterium]|nr:hypothetical protein [Spirochaetota bacterium]
MEHHDEKSCFNRLRHRYDCIDVEAGTDHGIYVANVTDYCIDEVSDHTMALLLACARKIVFLDRHVKNGSWNVKLSAPVYSISNKTLGLVGYGKIGRKVSQKAQAFGMKVISCDPNVSPEFMKQNNAGHSDLETLLKESDFVSLQVPLTKDTCHLIGEIELKMMKNTSFLINTSRGPLIDEKALYKALAKKLIAGAGIDVVEEEPLAGYQEPLAGYQGPRPM